MLDVNVKEIIWRLLVLGCAACGPTPRGHALPKASAPALESAPARPAPESAATAASPEGARVRLGPAAPFAFADLVRRAEDLAQNPYQPPPALAPDVLESIDYDAHGKLKYKSEYALFAEGPGSYPVTFFHLGRYFRVPVRMHVVQRVGDRRQSREVEYDASYFEMPLDSPARKLSPAVGFAGLRFQESRAGDQTKKPWQTNDWVAFLGATYFRAIGAEYQYGISARALAIDVASPKGPEEFPTFTDFFIETPEAPSGPVTVHALLEGPSVTGAVEFVMDRQEGVVMKIKESIFLRRDVQRLGIAPLTSMYWYSEKTRGAPPLDWRPEVHDSDGLALWTGPGESIWRPLNNPARVTVSSFVDHGPRGFGLSQRDRNFDHYLDGVRYERRPSLWVEPVGDWGPGAVQLVEIPTDDEVHDNIVAMWVPAGSAQAHARYDFEYRLHWLADEPYPSPLARVVATRLGRGGEPGKPRPAGMQKFVVELLGGPLGSLPAGVLPEPVLSASRGEFANVFVEAVPDDVVGHWRVQFDLSASGSAPVELRLFLRHEGQALSETWLYQWHPPS